MLVRSTARWALVLLAVAALGGCDLTGPEPGVTVDGVVVDADEAPIEGALLRVVIGLDGTGGELATTESDADGAFTLQYQRPGTGAPHLLASKDGYQSVGANLSRVANGRIFVTVQMVEEEEATPGS